MEVVTKYLKTANKFKVATRALALAAVVTGGLMANSMVQKKQDSKNNETTIENPCSSESKQNQLYTALFGLSALGTAYVNGQRKKYQNKANLSLQEIEESKQKNIPVDEYRKLTNSEYQTKDVLGGDSNTTVTIFSLEETIDEILKPTLKYYEGKDYKVFTDEDLTRLNTLIAQADKFIQKNENIPMDIKKEIVEIYQKKRLYPYI